jgi:hypothetical protein
MLLIDYTALIDSLLAQAACMRAALFAFNVPPAFATKWLCERLFEQKPAALPLPVAPTCDFCLALLTSKIEATIGNVGDMIGWESDNNTMGPIAAAAKQSLLRLCTHLLPSDCGSGNKKNNNDDDDDDDYDNEGNATTSVYHLVLEHGDFGIHIMSIAMDARGQLLMMSLYDWEAGCLV